MAALPVRPAEALTDTHPVLILAPHPDDESLGCGGLIAACCAAGAAVHVLITTDGAGSHPGSLAYPPARLAALRQQEARAAVAALGLPPGQIDFLGLRDTASPLDGPELDAACGSVAALARRLGARTLLATWAHDPHHDHLAAHRIAARVAATAGLRHVAYPIWGLTLPHDAPFPAPLPTGFRIDIAGHLDRKRRAIAAHRSQYAGLITDAPDGFQLPAPFLALFDRPFETFLDVAPGS